MIAVFHREPPKPDTNLPDKILYRNQVNGRHALKDTAMCGLNGQLENNDSYQGIASAMPPRGVRV
jgi:hypothetical protein